MQVAKTKSGQWIDARQAKRGVDYYCGRCHRIVRCRRTKTGAFFYHYHGRDKKKEYQNESYQHREAKQQLARWFQQQGYHTQLEYESCPLQRTDVFVQPNIALEVQYSPLSAKDYRFRHEGYKQAEKIDYWLLAGRYYQQWSHFYPFIQWSSRCGFHYYRYHDGWQLYYHLTAHSETVEVMTITHYPFCAPLMHPKAYIWQNEYNKQYRQLRMQLHHPTALLKQIQWRWYAYGKVMQDVPELCLPLSLPCRYEVEWALKTAYLLEDNIDEALMPVDNQPFKALFIAEYEQRLNEFYHFPPPMLWI